MDSLTMRQTQVQVRVNSFVRSVYNWMAIGLALTGFTAYAVANMPEVRSVIFGSGIVFFGLIIAQLALVLIDDHEHLFRLLGDIRGLQHLRLDHPA